MEAKEKKQILRIRRYQLDNTKLKRKPKEWKKKTTP